MDAITDSYFLAGKFPFFFKTLFTRNGATSNNLYYWMNTMNCLWQISRQNGKKLIIFRNYKLIIFLQYLIIIVVFKLCFKFYCCLLLTNLFFTVFYIVYIFTIMRIIIFWVSRIFIRQQKKEDNVFRRNRGVGIIQYKVNVLYTCGIFCLFPISA